MMTQMDNNYNNINQQDYTSRKIFMHRIKTALGTECNTVNIETETGLSDADRDLVRLVKNDYKYINPAQTADLIELFITNAEKVGVVVKRVAGDIDDGKVAIGNLLDSGNVATIAVADHKLNELITKTVNACTKNCRIFDRNEMPKVGSSLMGEFQPVDVGITDVEAAIAESGTLVMNFGDDQSGLQRRCSVFMPAVHIVLVKASQVVGDLLDYMQAADDRRTQSKNTVFITGPSKTADIEGVLVQGMHGPGKLYVVLFEAI